MEAAKRAPKGFQWAKQKAVKEADCFAGDDTRLKDLGLKFRDAVVLGLAGWLLGAESSEAHSRTLWLKDPASMSSWRISAISTLLQPGCALE